MADRKTLNYAEAENIAALAMHFGLSEKHRAAYDSALEGDHIGFYTAAISGAVALEKFATKKDISWGNDADWIITMEKLSEAMLDFMIDRGRVPNDDDLKKLVEESIDYF